MIENNNKIQILAFKSDKQIEPQFMYKYSANFIAPNIDSNKAACLNSIVYNLKKFEKDAYIMNNDEYIFITKKLSENERICKIENKEVNVKFTLESYDKVSLSETKIYETYIRDLCQKNILESDKNFEKLDYDLAIKLNRNLPNITCYRVFKIDIKLLEDNYFLLYVKLFTKFTSNKTILDMSLSGEKFLGRSVRYTGFYLSKPFSGVLVKDGDPNTPDEFKTVDGLYNYYRNRYPNYNFYQNPNDFVVHLLKNDGQNINFLASMMSPIWSFEEIRNNLGERYSKLAREIVLLKPSERFKEAQIIPRSINILKEIGDIGFNKNEDGNLYKYAEPKDAGFETFNFEEPDLLIGNNKIIKANPIEKRTVLNSDYFYTPETFSEGICIALIPTSLKTKKEHMIKLADNIFKLGLYNMIPKEKIKFVFSPIVHQDFGIFASKIKSVFNPNLALVTLSDDKIKTEFDMDTHEEFYPKLKEAFAAYQIPSQMISFNQTGKIYSGSPDAKWVIYNVNFGVLGKLGAIPYSFKDNIKDVDIYIGLDVGKDKKGIHYPSLGAAFMGDGKFMGGFCNSTATTGEKIPRDDLKNILDKVIGLYLEKAKKPPKRMVIHRDGFSREDDEWYNEFFTSKNMEYALVEVVKTGAPRLILSDQDDIKSEVRYGNNAPIGTALFKENECILVTTDPIGGTSAPLTIRLRGKNFDLNIHEAALQVYNLSKINAASNHNTRLPITTKYADIISKHPTYIPHNQVTGELYWI